MCVKFSHALAKTYCLGKNWDGFLKTLLKRGVFSNLKNHKYGRFSKESKIKALKFRTLDENVMFSKFVRMLSKISWEYNCFSWENSKNALFEPILNKALTIQSYFFVALDENY